MDFTPELSAFQGVIISADNVHSFARLTARGGNEDQIDYVVDNMLRFLEQQRYIIENYVNEEKIVKMRKFAYYIILNADLPALEQLVENDGIDSVIWTVPTIPKCLMSEMLWKLHMDKFIYEAIAFSCPQLALELASALIDHLKYFTPIESLQKLKLISSACYKQTCRLHFFNFENDVQANLLAVALNNFQKCMNYFIEPPNCHKLPNMRKDEQYKFKGHCLDAMLHLINECVSDFTKVPQFTAPNFHEVYQLTYKVGSYKDDALNFLACNSPNKAILECLDNSNEMLLDTCKHLVMDVSVDIFCAWSEFEENGKSMQETIGEYCFNLRTKLMTVNVISDHPVVNMLQQISRKPVDIQELVNTSSSDIIVENIQRKDENHSEWVRALLQKDKLCHDITLLRVLASNLEILNIDECYNLFSLCKTHLRNNSENSDMVKVLAVKVFQICSTDIKYVILDNYFTGHCFTDLMETSDFNQMTEIFNKVIAEVDADLTDILTVFLQNPQKVYEKIFNLSAESSHQADIMLRAMKLLDRYSNYYYNQDTEPCIIRVAETVLDSYLENEVSQMNFIRFICGLKSANIIPGSKLLLLIIMPKLHRALLDQDVHCIHFQCKLLSESFTIDELLAYRAPMLAMLAQILEVVRWRINTFVEEGPSALQLALELQQKLFDTYSEGIPEREDRWLKSKLLRKLHPLNCFYYRKLWNPPGGNYVEIVSGTQLGQNMDTTQLMSWLSRVLPSTIQSEWCVIWDSLPMLESASRLDLFHNALSIVTLAEAANRTDTVSWECILQCYRNFVYIVRYKFFVEPLTSEQVTKVANKIKATSGLVEESASEPLCTVFLPLIAYMITRKEDYAVSLSSILCDNLKNRVFKERVDRLFTNSNGNM